MILLPIHFTLTPRGFGSCVSFLDSFGASLRLFVQRRLERGFLWLMVIPVYSCSLVYFESVSVPSIPHSTGYTVRTWLCIYAGTEI